MGLLVVLLIIIVSNVFDSLLTITILNRGGEELNPIVSSAIDSYRNEFWIWKFVITSTHTTELQNLEILLIKANDNLSPASLEFAESSERAVFVCQPKVCGKREEVLTNRKVSRTSKHLLAEGLEPY